MKLLGELTLPGDKSISHRAIMLNSIAHGEAKIYNLLFSQDTITTIEIFKQLGVTIEVKDDHVLVVGNGFSGLKAPGSVLNCYNSGTTARLLLGLCSGLDFKVQLTGDHSLVKRPMKRVVKHLQPLGSQIQLTNDNYLPALINSSQLKPCNITLDVASAQVKSAVLLAALKNERRMVVTECQKTRNHTELMLEYLGCDIQTHNLDITISGQNKLTARNIVVPGDISSAAFFIVAALILKDSAITIKQCGINPTRTGIFTILDQIGADYELKDVTFLGNEQVCDLIIRYSHQLKPFVIDQSIIPDLVDEIPILALLATQIDGVSIIKDAEELRIKETDRIVAVVTELSKLGAHIEETENGMIITGKTTLIANKVKSYEDHRISMMLKVARLMTDYFIIEGGDSDKISYPNFEADLMQLIK